MAKVTFNATKITSLICPKSILLCPNLKLLIISSLILNIDTATNIASICIAAGNDILGQKSNAEQKNHAAFIQPAIEALLHECGIVLQQLDAIAITSGPGSYTGLRVGFSTAKGLCYALNKPLICCNTLEVMATATAKAIDNTSNTLFCPMIDARRMEVFTAVYDCNVNTIMEPTAMILDENSFTELLSVHKIVFSGDGSQKWKEILTNDNAVFADMQHNATNLAQLSKIKFDKNDFSELAYSEPFYLKEVYTTVANVKV